MILRPLLLALTALAAAAMLLAACDAPPGGVNATTPGSSPSGVRGTVILGPTCPGGAPDATDPVTCLTPYAAQLVVIDGEGNVVGRVNSGADGRFELSLPPGDYVITPLGGDPYPIAQPVSVVVRPNEFAELQINYDTGIR